jgi:hypothetical protein
VKSSNNRVKVGPIARLDRISPRASKIPLRLGNWELDRVLPAAYSERVTRVTPEMVRKGAGLQPLH